MFLKSKLSPPRVRAPFVRRPRLDDMLDTGLSCPLLLVSSEAGSGKSALVASWIARARLHAAWVSLDEGDDDPVRFWNYVIEALRGPLPGIGQGAREALTSIRLRELDAVIAQLTVELSAALENLDKPLVLILDDYHRAESTEVSRSLDIFLDLMPPSMNIVVITRQDPTLSLPRRRVSRTLFELRYADLKMELDEVRAYCKLVVGDKLSPDHGAALEKLTEGWIAGLQLAVLNLKNRADASGFIESFDGDNHFIADYLAQEVLDAQTTRVREFLYATSVLSELRADLCAAVADGFTVIESQRMLRQLEQSHLFLIPLDDRRELFRYHHLFAAALRTRVADRFPERYVELHRRAAHWYFQQGIPVVGFGHVQRCHDVDVAAGVVNEFVDDILWKSTEYRELESWLQSLPPAARSRLPKLWLAEAWLALLRGEMQETDTLLAGAADAISRARAGRYGAYLRAEHAALTGVNEARRTGDLESRQIEVVLTAMEGMPPDSVGRRVLATALAEMYCLVGDFERGAPLWREVVDSGLRAGDRLTCVIAISRQQDIAFIRGDLIESNRIAQTLQSAFAQRDGQDGLTEIGLGWCVGRAQYESGDLERAERSVLEGIKRSARANRWFVLQLSKLATIIQCAKGDALRALETVGEAVRLQRGGEVYSDWSGLSAQMLAASVCLRLRRVAIAREWVDQSDFDPSNIDFGNERDAVIYGQLIAAEGKLEAAVTLLDRVADTALDAGRRLCFLEAKVASALALESAGERVRAVRALVRALEVAAPFGHHSVFLNNPPAIRALLGAAAAESAEVRPMVRRLLGGSAEADYEPPFSISVGHGQTAGSGEAVARVLTDRETEVLALIAGGYSNKEVAQMLSLSPHTVKVHARNIYSKLGVRTRTQALIRAKSLQILN